MKRLLVVVDYQKDFVDGSLGFEGAELLDRKIVNKIKEYINIDREIIYTMDSHDEDYLETREGKMLPIKHCIVGTDGWELYGETKKIIKSISSIPMTKTTFGIPPDTMMILKSVIGEVDSIEFVGLVTNMCIISNVAVFQAAYPEAQIIVNPTLCDSFDKELHAKTIDVLRGMQVKIIE